VPVGVQLESGKNLTCCKVLTNEGGCAMIIADTAMPQSHSAATAVQVIRLSNSSKASKGTNR